MLPTVHPPMTLSTIELLQLVTGLVLNIVAATLSKPDIPRLSWTGVNQKITWHTSYDLYWRTYPRQPVYPRSSIQQNGFQSSYSTFVTGLLRTSSNRKDLGPAQVPLTCSVGDCASAKSFMRLTYL